MKSAQAVLVLATSAAFAACADYKVDMNSIDVQGVQKSLGTIEVTAAPSGGVTFTPMLRGLPPGEHGFHVHEFDNCGAREKDGKLAAGEMAGGHWDPDKAAKHAGPAGPGHRGDLPALKVAPDGTATQAVTASKLTLADLRKKSLMIHAGGDNFSDQPKPNGGGGDRIVCGTVTPGEK
jgi:Cu-Zn family superoxide dismutase